MTQQVHPQLVQGGKHLGAVLAGVLSLAVESPDVLAYDAVFLEDLLAMGTCEGVIVAVLWNMHFKLQDVIEALLANGAFKDLLPYEVGLYMTRQGGIV